MLHHAAEREGVGGGEAPGFQGVTKDFVGRDIPRHIDVGAPGAIDVDHRSRGHASAEGDIVAILMLKLLVVGCLEGELADVLLDHGGDDIVGPVEVVADAAEVEGAIEAAKELLRAVRHAHADGLAFE